MRFATLLESAGVSQELPTGLAAVSIGRVVEDSRQVAPGDLFVARSGTQLDGAHFVGQALDRGAAAALVIVAPQSGQDRARPQVDDPRVLTVAGDATLLGRLCHLRLGSPGERLRVLAVTGTNGKTSVVSFLQQLLEASGYRAATIGTLGYDTGANRFEARETTPGAPRIAELVAEAVAAGCTHLCLEASSHALEQGRLAGLELDVGIVTNVTRDHLDYHGTLERYAAAKAALASHLKEAGALLVPEREGGAGMPLLLDAVSGSVQVHHYSVLHGHSLPGEHNAWNVGAAFAALLHLGCDVASLLPAVRRLHAAPGRLERVDSRGTGPHVYVDYAHNPDGLTRVLTSLRSRARGRVHLVFGCGGDRDRGKRAPMGRVASELADELWVTSDNPRGEDPLTIAADVVEGILDGTPRHVLLDRKAAIAAAIAAAHPADVVLIAGKGHETTQETAGRKTPHDDREVARTVLESLVRTAV